MAIVFFGSPEFAVPSLVALLEAGEDVAAVVTQTDKPRGRGRTAPQPSAVKKFAQGEGIRVLQPRSMKDEAFISELNAISPEFIVVVAYGRVLTQAVLDAPTVAPVNLHASLLPAYRGSSPINWAIINGEQDTGITTMTISLGLDEGDILLQERHKILSDDTALSLALRLSVAGGPLLVRTLSGMRDGTVKPVPQEGQSNYIPMLKKDDGHVDWSRSALHLDFFVRGMHPWPGAFCYIEDTRIRLLRVKATPGNAAPGTITSVRRDSFAVGTGEGLIEVLELQPEGKRPMSARDFLAGRKILKGTMIK